jgi:GntR family transcriptional repressor for pyruvate dehydrogenase complex
MREPGAKIDESAETLSVLAPIARSSIVDAVVERIRGEILAGRLAPGSRLPSEREMSLALGINRLTLRAALARLEAVGLIITRHGAGTIVASWRERAGLDALGALSQALAKDDPARTELMAAILEVRRVLAAEAVALAAARATEDDIKTMREIAEAQRANLDDPVAMARGDVAFQRAVLRAAGNVGLELILNTFARFPDEQPELVAQLYDVPQRTFDHYPLVIGLIEAREVNTARELVRSALEVVDRELVKRHTPAPTPPAKKHRSKKKTGGKR